MLVACEECSQKISDQAVACPHCGAPFVAYDKATGQRADTSALRVRVRDLDVPFGALLVLGFKLAIAWLPAMLVLAVLIGAAVGYALDSSDLLQLLRTLKPGD